MYMDALESEVESLSAEVTRLRLMLQRVTQVMEFPVSVDGLPSYRDPVAASLSRTDPRSGTPASVPTNGAAAISVPVELLQLLLEQQKSRDVPRADAPRTAARQATSSRTTTRHAPDEVCVATPSASRAASTSSATSTLVSDPAAADGNNRGPTVPQSTGSSTRPPSSGDKSKDKVASTATLVGKSRSSSTTRPAASVDDAHAAAATGRKKSVIANPVTAEWRLPSPMTNTVPPIVRRPPQPIVAPPPPVSDEDDHHHNNNNTRDESRATTANTRRSQSDSVMPARRISMAEGSAESSEVEETGESGSQAVVSASSRKESQGTMVSNSAWASAMHGYFDDGSAPSERRSSQPGSQLLQPAAVGPSAASANVSNPSVESSQQVMFSYSMFGSLVNASPAMSSVQARSVSAAAPLPLPVVDEVIDTGSRKPPVGKARPNNNSQNEELPSSSHVVNSKKVPRQTSVMTYRSDDTDNDDEGPAAQDPSSHLSRATAAPLQPTVLGGRRGVSTAPLALNEDSPVLVPRQGSEGPRASTHGPGARPSATAPGIRTPQHKKSVFDILREQGDDSSDSASSGVASAEEENESSGRSGDGSADGNEDDEDMRSDSQQGRVPTSGSPQASMSYGTAREIYSAGFYSPQFTPHESAVSQSPGASLPPGTSYMGYEYDLGLETSRSRSRSPGADQGKDDGGDSSNGGYYPI